VKFEKAIKLSRKSNAEVGIVTRVASPEEKKAYSSEKQEKAASPDSILVQVRKKNQVVPEQVPLTAVRKLPLPEVSSQSSVPPLRKLLREDSFTRSTVPPLRKLTREDSFTKAIAPPLRKLGSSDSFSQLSYSPSFSQSQSALRYSTFFPANQSSPTSSNSTEQMLLGIKSSNSGSLQNVLTPNSASAASRNRSQSSAMRASTLSLITGALSPGNDSSASRPSAVTSPSNNSSASRTVLSASAPEQRLTRPLPVAPTVLSGQRVARPLPEAPNILRGSGVQQLFDL
jgi:hypothetical protein